MNFVKTILFFCCLLSVFGCSSKMGGFISSSKYVYPNSNVTVLGSASASMTKTSFIIPPNWTKADIDSIFADALKKYPGADMLVNYKSDTTTTFPLLPIMYWSTIVVEGTAAKMTIGKKELSKR